MSTAMSCHKAHQYLPYGMQKRFADDEDFQLATAETALLAKQAAELQDYDQLPTAATQQAPPVVPVKGSADAPALKHSTSMPASTAAAKAAAPAETTAPEAVMKPAHPVLLHSASMPAATTKAASAAADEAKAAADEAKPAADEARAAAEQQAWPQLPAGLSALLNRVPSSPLRRSTQELHSGANAAVAAAAAPAAADANGAANAAAPAAASADGAATAAAAAPAVSEGASQKSQSKVWRPPFAVTSSPQRSSGTSAQQAASSMPAGTPAKEPSHTQARSQAAAGVTAEKRSLTEGPASPLGALADKACQMQRMLAKKRKCPEGESHDSQERDMQATRGSKSARFRSDLDSLARESQGKKAMEVDEGAQKEKTNGHAGKSLQAIAARQMAEALSKKKQNRSAGMGLA